MTACESEIAGVSIQTPPFFSEPASDYPLPQIFSSLEAYIYPEFSSRNISKIQSVNIFIGPTFE